FFFTRRRRHTSSNRDWSSDVCSSDLDWPRHEAEGFAWWKQRMRHATSIYDVVRIDHFRGFESYFSIPAGSATAQGGQWVKGPGQIGRASCRESGEVSVVGGVRN